LSDRRSGEWRSTGGASELKECRPRIRPAYDSALPPGGGEPDRFTTPA